MARYFLDSPEKQNFPTHYPVIRQNRSNSLLIDRLYILCRHFQRMIHLVDLVVGYSCCKIVSVTSCFSSYRDVPSVHVV